MRLSPPWDSREETSVESTASRKRSCDHSSSRARSASLATPGPRPAPSARGTGARARRSWLMPGSGVIAGERAQLDLGLALRGAARRAALERRLVGGVGEGQAAGEDARVAGGELARVQRDRGDLRWQTRTSTRRPNEPWVKRVVVAVKAQIGLRGTRVTKRRSVSGMRSGSARIRSRSSDRGARRRPRAWRDARAR